MDSNYFDEPLGEGILPLRMMQIPAGSFLMGSPPEELERQEQEGPQHEVTLSRFFMAKYPVTQAQWRLVAKLPQIGRELLIPAPSSFKGALRPVECVSWYDAVEFCERLSVYTRRTYRLPSEAEWEYACRAGTATPFHFGETLSTDQANYNGTDEKCGAYGPGSRGDYRQGTTPVNYFGAANAYGLCDMHGNVWEWCQDHWHGNYEKAPTDGSAWIDEDPEWVSHVIRGGSWVNLPRICRSACRCLNYPDYRYNSLGFRVCCAG